jgi:hypothetical protein
MALIKLAALGALGYAGYRYFSQRSPASRPAFAKGQAGGDNFAQVRDAGPAAMADRPARRWSKVDEASDQSFPASDPPGNY